MGVKHCKYLELNIFGGIGSSIPHDSEFSGDNLRKRTKQNNQHRVTEHVDQCFYLNVNGTQDDTKKKMLQLSFSAFQKGKNTQYD